MPVTLATIEVVLAGFRSNFLLPIFSPWVDLYDTGVVRTLPLSGEQGQKRKYFRKGSGLHFLHLHRQVHWLVGESSID